MVWCITVPHGAFIARRNGLIFATGNSGFPKSLDVSKAIDKAAGAEREVIGLSPHAANRSARSWQADDRAPTGMARGDEVSAPSPFPPPLTRRSGKAGARR